MSETLFTIGHSNRAIDALVDLLRFHSIKSLVDVRAVPQSARNPQFDTDRLRAALEAAGIIYHWAGRQLGGRRPMRPDSLHIALSNGLRGFADYMDSEDFKRGAAHLRRLAGHAPTAMLCAERMPEDCHRSLVSDYLVLGGMQVLHIIDPDDVREHYLRPEARRESARLIYDRNVSGELF